jgi:hypothetical protein
MCSRYFCEEFLFLKQVKDHGSAFWTFTHPHVTWRLMGTSDELHYPHGEFLSHKFGGH